MGRSAGQRAVGVVTALALALAGAACGDDDEDGAGSATTQATTSTVPSGAEDLDGFLVGADELAGLSPAGEPMLIGSLRAYAIQYGLPDAEERRLADNGFLASVTYMLAGASAEVAGISAVDLFATEDGAARELAHLVDTKEADAPSGIENFVRFEVPGVAGAVGWTFDKPGGSSAADLHWAQGRCVMSLGSEPPLVDELRAAVQAIYDRTGATCP